ncbi:hypothetical protein GWK48_06070 [Metallosphaera tengchongensis]|uniref:MarR family transcriptional regulator n=1 Tax=Metallosphaera tengchongensis TaxID=1532350 RepID=A0A6N0NTI1_9CREN|nr:hypothetical protein [Metallosphaera tengchongensis]QKR00002.1 hypothetical protein GWK48_06070 [Metallosphaera tengchongensis]
MTIYNAIVGEFYDEVLFDVLGPTERDIEFLHYVRDAERENADVLPKTGDVVKIAKVGKPYMINVLKSLERKGLVSSEKLDNAF